MTFPDQIQAQVQGHSVISQTSLSLTGHRGQTEAVAGHWVKGGFKVGSGSISDSGLFTDMEVGQQ